MSPFENNSVFWIEVDKIRPNPYQPRREFDEEKLSALADSIRQYGILQPLVVTRYETPKDDGGLAVGYELIAGERRLRAARLAGLSQIPATIRSDDHSDRMKLELAIIENLQREDLNPIEKARAFQQLVSEFGFKHVEIGKKLGKSREYVSNTIRLLALPEEMQQAICEGNISEGHARPLLMLSTRPDEQNVLYREVLLKRLTVRDTESLARRVATDRVRKRAYRFSSDVLELEKELTETLGTRVQIEPREVGGKVVIDFFSDEDLQSLLGALRGHIDSSIQLRSHDDGAHLFPNTTQLVIDENGGISIETPPPPLEAENTENDEQDEGDLYAVRGFSI